jgi:hypothetical protein
MSIGQVVKQSKCHITVYTPFYREKLRRMACVLKLDMNIVGLRAFIKKKPLQILQRLLAVGGGIEPPRSS